jgi:hypothetical protein
MVLGRTGGENTAIKFEDLGLDKEREYFVFEFWSRKLLGAFSGAFLPGEVDPKFNCQVFCIRERRAHPQILATNRHITGGGVDLVDVRWEGNRLSGKSRVVGGDVYELFISIPPGFAFNRAECDGAAVLEGQRDGAVLCLSLKSDQSREVAWAVLFQE